MPDLLWTEVKNFFDPHLMGALPDLWVPDTSVEDWQAVFDLVRPNGWAIEYVVDDIVLPLPAAAEFLPRAVDAEEHVVLWVRPAPAVTAIFYPMSATEIDFDVDLRELQGQAGVDTLCGFISALGRRLGKPVFMAAEGQYGYPLLGFDPAADRVVLFADPIDPGA
ncbi:hypothetical protein FEK33_06680 [Nocardia asteroides NBRC 15531]|nr:hypothetical protein [Nocardia asteroides]TLF69934.1 hypothetical protein FEK33_06680 [Nocardia asteroides NBRC 15531]UGT49445.1 hypothetical protein LT345_02155 [Nocardia asteroides]SFL90743.1 hypothetical protein SAMN05444423_1011353 [Nocardia asteroides]VEG38016.1 Uncharacterised protein [Nocardia asteroides]